MAFKLFEWYCKPVKGGVWEKYVENAFGPYTPCANDCLVICISHLILLGLCLNRIWRMKKDFSVQRFQLRSNWYNYVLGLLALYCTVEPLVRLVMGISAFNVDSEHGVAPYEMISLIIESVTWCSMLVMIGLETKVYIRESRWSVRFGVIYALVGDAVMVNLVLSVKDYYDWSVLCLYMSEVAVQALFGVLYLVHIPYLDSYPGYLLVENIDDIAYEELPGGEQVCPERNHICMDGSHYATGV